MNRPRKYKLLFLFFIGFQATCLAQNWDIDLLKDLNLHRNRSLDSFFIIITDYAAPLAYSLPLILFVIAVAKRKKNTS